MQNKEEFLDAIKKGSQTSVNEVIEKEIKHRVAEEIEEIEESVAKNLLKESSTYDKVFNAVAKHMEMDPEDIDEVDDETKKEFFDMVDKCWDEDSDEVSDACPVNIEAMSESYKNSSKKKKMETGAEETEEELAAVERARREVKNARKKGMDPEDVAEFNAKELEKKFGMDRKKAHDAITDRNS